MPASIAVAIVGGEPVVGHALKQLIEAAGYAARYVPEPAAASAALAGSLAGVSAVLLSPVLDVERKESLLKEIEDKPSERRITLLDLPWPCGSRGLQQTIEKALLASDTSVKSA